MSDPTRAARPIDVLFVDDDQAVCGSMSRCLQRVGFQVRVATSGTAALGAVAERRPDVIVTDQQMPKMSGSELIARLLALDPSFKGRIILTSGDLPADSSAEALVQTGAKALPKPYSAGELALAIRAAAGRSTLTTV